MMCFLSDLVLRNFFLSFDLTIIALWISLFMKGAWFARINLLFNGAIVLTIDRQVSLKYFRSLSLICKVEFLSLFSIWSLKRVFLKNFSCGNSLLLVSVLQKMVLVLLGSFCGSRRAWFRTCKSFGSIWAHFLWSNQHEGLVGFL